jgi:hypothetical protein
MPAPCLRLHALFCSPQTLSPYLLFRLRRRFRAAVPTPPPLAPPSDIRTCGQTA